MSEKSDDALRTIGEASEELGVKSHILRYWEEQFPMLEPLKRAGSRRYYRSEDMALLRQIDTLLNKQGYTVKGAVKYLKGAARGAPVSDMAGLPEISEKSPALDEDKLRQLNNIRKTLAEALASA